MTTDMERFTAQRVRSLPPYLFAELDRKRDEAIARGVDVIDLGVGDPDLPTPGFVLDALARAASDPSNHRYPPYAGKARLREAIAGYMERRFGVRLDPDEEILVLIGSKEGIAHLAWAVVDPGDTVYVPDPAYPVYESTARFCGADVRRFPLLPERGFVPDPGEIAELVRQSPGRAKLLWLNYPNNPTAGVVDLEFFQQIGEVARRFGLLVANDNSYAEVYLDGRPPVSILQVPGALDWAVEFFSFSKTFNMTGWRVGWVAGNREAVAALGRVKTNVDSGVFGAIQDAAAEALEGHRGWIEELRARYRRRRDVLVEALLEAGWQARRPAATFFVPVRVPEGVTSMQAASWLLERAGVVSTPMSAMGPGGEGFLRFSLTAPDERLREAAERIARAGHPG